MHLPQSVSFEKYARAFFSSPVFKLERIIIALTTGKKTTERSVDELISGQSDDFAVWQVEDFVLSISERFRPIDDAGLLMLERIAFAATFAVQVNHQTDEKEQKQEKG